MTLAPYRQVLALPGFRSLQLVALLARIPVTAASVTLTLHVVHDLDRGYGAAGLVGTALTIGAALGAPLMGRLVDRRGLRPMLVLTTAAEAAFWLGAQALPYPALLVAAFFGGLLTLPMFSVIRQSVAALVPAEQRRSAYALDSMSVELSFMVGPALGVLMVTNVSARAAMIAVGCGIVLSGLALFALNAPVRADDESEATARPSSRRQWLTPRLIGVLVTSTAATVVLSGTDVAVIAALQEADQVTWTGVVLAAWGAYSMVGGFAYGSISRPVPSGAIVALLGLCTMPIGLGGSQWWLLALALVPAGALCAPAIASTANAVSRMAPPSVRGEAMGLHGSAITVGNSLGAPLAGAVIDLFGPAWGFAVTGLVGALAAFAVLSGERRRPTDVPAAVPELADTPR